jgi:hypothetical protein
MQEEKKIAQLIFLKQNKFSFYFQNTSFFVWARKTCKSRKFQSRISV